MRIVLLDKDSPHPPGIWWGRRLETGFWISKTPVMPLLLLRQIDAWYLAFWRFRVRVMKPWRADA
jgi:hypothetical protein